jgi:hypothetical protein
MQKEVEVRGQDAVISKRNFYTSNMKYKVHWYYVHPDRIMGRAFGSKIRMSFFAVSRK